MPPLPIQVPVSREHCPVFLQQPPGLHCISFDLRRRDWSPAPFAGSYSAPRNLIVLPAYRITDLPSSCESAHVGDPRGCTFAIGLSDHLWPLVASGWSPAFRVSPFATALTPIVGLLRFAYCFRRLVVVDRAQPMRHSLGNRVPGSKVLAPYIAPCRRADPNAAILVRAFDFE